MNVLIVDDHPLVREGLASLLAELAPPPRVIEAADAASACRAVAGTDFQLALLDLLVPGAEGLSLFNTLRALRPELPIVVVSASDGREQVHGALEAGAMGFISKRAPTAVLVNAIRLVLAGGVYVPPHVLASAAGGPSGPAPQRREPMTPADLGLTGRQGDVLALMVQGFTNKMICRDLGLAEGTVKSHISAILKALNAGNRTQALFALSRLKVQVLPREQSVTSS